MINIHNEINKNLEYITNADIKLALHSWIPPKVNAILFYIHGIQSHAQWLFETGPNLAANSIAVFVLDRRGCGLSEGRSGDVPTATHLLTDYYLALKYIKNKYSKVPLTLFGNSLGGSIIAGLLCWPLFDIPCDAVVFCASALAKQHYQLSPEDQYNILNNQAIDLQPVHICDEDYTNEPIYLDFIKKDLLGSKKITSRMRASLLEIEKLYWQKEGVIKNIPSAYVYPRIDPLVNIPNAINTFMKLNSNNGITLQLPTDKHYLWFTAQRKNLEQWLSQYVLTVGYENV